MTSKAHPRRYAQAAFELALETNELEPWQATLDAMAEAVADAGVLAALESPKISLEKKIGLLEAGLGKEAPPAFMNLARLLIARNSAGIMADIAAEYRQLADAHRGILHADVVTAVPIDSEESARLAEQLGTLVAKKIELDTTVDPAILGGVIARVGGKLLDGSTRSKLASLKRQLTSGEKRR